MFVVYKKVECKKQIVRVFNFKLIDKCFFFPFFRKWLTCASVGMCVRYRFFLRLRESVLKKNKTHPNGSVYDDHFYNSFRGG